MVRVERSSLAASGTMFWSINSPTGIHKSDDSSHCDPSWRRDKDIVMPRRLFDPETRSFTGGHGERQDVGLVPFSQPDCQFFQIGLNTGYNNKRNP